MFLYRETMSYGNLHPNEYEYPNENGKYGNNGDEEYPPNEPLHPLYTAVIAENIAEINRLLTNGVDINQVLDEYGNAAIHIAIAFGKVNALHELLRHGANVNLNNWQNETPLITARTQFDSYGSMSNPVRIAMFRSLIDAGADIEATDADDNTFLMSILQATSRSGLDANMLRFIQYLLSKNPNTDAALLAATSYNKPRSNANVVRLLLNAGANKNVVSPGGETPLMTTTSPAIGAHLLGRRANLTKRNARGVTALNRYMGKGFDPANIARRMGGESWRRRRAAVLTRATAAAPTRKRKRYQH